MRQTGTVKFFNSTKGYGFITPEDGTNDIFVHISALQHSGIQDVAEGTKLAFDVEDDRRGRGKQAANLELS